MTLELFVNQYFVVETQTKKIHDSPTIGTSEIIEISRTKYGPYSTNTDAEKKIDSLKVEKINEGWRQLSLLNNVLFKDVFDIYYQIKQDSKPV